MLSCQSRDVELIKFCLSGPHDRIIGGMPEGNLVVKISEEIVIKFGPGVCEDEAKNQQEAYELLDPKIIRVPRVHRFFSDECGRGYIIMDYIEGRVVDQLGPDHIKRLVRVLDYFGTLKRKTPGSLSGAPCRGLLWPETEHLSFADIEEMENWFNSKLFPGQGKISFQTSDLVLCHLDLAPRNIIWQSDCSFCLVDWASAGFFPRLFEFWAQWIIEGKDGAFNKNLLDAMTPLQDHEIQQKPFICRVWYNTQKYAL